MLPSVGAGFVGAAQVSAAAAIGHSLSQFAAHRRPWSEYLDLVSKEDGAAYSAPLNPGPMYRGRKSGKAGWLFDERVQLHYRRYPDERLVANLHRWRSGDTIGDIAMQQFRSVQPHLLDKPDEQGFKRPEPEVYMKLNYKNPLTLSRYLTRTGHFYSQDVLPLNPEAVRMLRQGLGRARRIGLYPKYGNPFWFRVQTHRPRPYKGDYDPLTASVKSTTEQFCFNWLQTYRVKTYFQQREAAFGRGEDGASAAKAGAVRGYGSGPRVDAPPVHAGANAAVHAASRSLSAQQGYKGAPGAVPYAPADLESSQKVSTVPGLMSIAGLKRNMHLYTGSSKKRMGFPNPLGTTKKL